MVKKELDQVKVSEWTLNPEHVKAVKDGMYGVVNEGGTGLRAALPHIEVCGKTGTAQLASNDFLKGGSAGKDMKDNAWFVGFAPRDNPEIVAVALFEHGGHGQFAAAIVRDVIKAYFDKKERVTQLQQNQTRTVATLGLGLTPSTAR
jgi:penicillin-binding protein 2